MPSPRPTQEVASRTPSLLNGPGVTSLDGVSVLGQRFDENLPLRDGVPLVVRLADGTERVIQSPVINTVPGAMPIQEVFENTEWVSQSGNPVAYAPHIRKAPLAGVSSKSVIYQFAKGDQIVPNPATTALLRAGDLADRTTFYRHDLAFAENPQLPTIPHGFLTRIDIPGFRAIAQGAQEQIATFFATNGATVIHPEPARFFETPIAGALPEGLNYILPPGPLGAAGASGATIADAQVVGTIVNDDVPLLSAVRIDDVSQYEGRNGNTKFTFTVTLDQPSTQSVSVKYATANGTATTTDSDYQATSRMLTFAPGETTKTITVLVKGDKKKESDETFFVNLFDPVNVLLDDALGIRTIRNDD